VILLPDNLFYNTTAAGIIVVLNCHKPAQRRGKVVLLNASGDFQKGRPKNFIPDELAALDGEAERLDAELKQIFTGLGYRWFRGLQSPPG
jgi:type I restriction enzyme M protein